MGREKKERGRCTLSEKIQKKTLKELRWRLGVGKERSRNC